MGRIFDILFGHRDVAPESRTLIGFSDGGLIPTGSVGGTTTLGLSSVWRCLDILSNGVSQLAWQERRGNLELPPSRLVDRPQSSRTRREWVSLVVSTMALFDTAPLLKIGEDSEGVPLELLPLDPNLVQPIMTDTWGIVPPTEYYVGATKVSADRLVILRRSPLPGVADESAGVIRLARVTFAAAIAAEAYASRYWQAGGAPTTVLETEQKLDPEQAQNLSDLWFTKRSRGPDYAPVLTSGLKARAHGADPTAESAVEARREMVADVGRYFGIPTRILNAPTGDAETYTSTPAANMDLIRYTLANYIGAIEDCISDLLPGRRSMVMDTRELTRDTMLNTATSLGLMTGQAPIMTVDEAREFLGLPPQETPSVQPAPKPAPVGGQANGQG
jgi:HK97 family phage portal protein